MELREMRVFIGVVEGGSLSAAGRRLGVSQSALSQTISSLERRLEVRLLERTRSGVYPTEAGRVLLDEARAVLDRHDRALTVLARKVDGDEEVLRLGLALELPPDLLARPFGVLQEVFPSTRVTVRHLPQAEQESELRTGGLDVGLQRGRPAGDQLDCLLVLEEPLGVLLTVREAARLAGPDGVSLESLTGLDWIGFPRHEAPGFHDEIAAVLRNHGLAVDEPRSDSRMLIPEVRFAEVAAGHAFSLAPAWLAGRTAPRLAHLVPARRRADRAAHLGGVGRGQPPARRGPLHRGLRRPRAQHAVERAVRSGRGRAGSRALPEHRLNRIPPFGDVRWDA